MHWSYVFLALTHGYGNCRSALAYMFACLSTVSSEHKPMDPGPQTECSPGVVEGEISLMSGSWLERNIYRQVSYGINSMLVNYLDSLVRATTCLSIHFCLVYGEITLYDAMEVLPPVYTMQTYASRAIVVRDLVPCLGTGSLIIHNCQGTSPAVHGPGEDREPDWIDETLTH